MALPAADEAPPVLLEAFETTAARVERDATLLPSERPLGGLHDVFATVLDLPRAATLLTPEVLRQAGVDTTHDLARVTPGTTTVNFFGIPGVPTTRGLFTGIYFNGMLRAWNRNGYPNSFESFEAMDHVRGPAPAHFSAAAPGGFVNLVPKGPYAERTRGSVRVSAGTYDDYRLYLDAGGPLGNGHGSSDGYRLALSLRDAGSYYRGINQRTASLYGAARWTPRPGLSFFGGGELYRYRGKEVPGWNRLTQDLIDRGIYVTGQPATDLTGERIEVELPDGRVFAWENPTPGRVNRAALETATPFGGVRGLPEGSFLQLGGYGSPGFRPGQLSENARFLYSFLGGIANSPAEPATVRLDPRTVLTDPDDFAKADTLLLFLDTHVTTSADWTLENKTFLDGYRREKNASYGYGEYGENLTLENKLILRSRLEVNWPVTYAAGASVRYEKALAKTDFTVEPFNRRDLTAGPTPNTQIPAGGERDRDGRTFWDPFGSWDTTLWTAGVFLTARVDPSETHGFSISGRLDHATWRRAVPFDLAADFNSGRKPGGGKTYLNTALSGWWRPEPRWTTYLTAQRGAAFHGYYLSGSVNRGDENFQESSLIETGLKYGGAGSPWFFGAALYHQDLVHFDERGGIVIPQRGRGLELEAVYDAGVPGFALTANAAWQEHYWRSEMLPGGFVPLSLEDLVNYAGIFSTNFGGSPNPGGTRFGIPRLTANVLARYETAAGWGAVLGPSYVRGYPANAQKTIHLPSHWLWMGALFFRGDAWEARLSGTNLTNTTYFMPNEAFVANSLILRGPGRRWDLSVTRYF
ncbi:MAG: hypothetical protein EA425_01095 [Puniceicoccaceae bacterium]|nr:MAG: hypothetical protein EA425_01095 [Puniceicoccaceae bacterium]